MHCPARVCESMWREGRSGGCSSAENGRGLEHSPLWLLYVLYVFVRELECVCVHLQAERVWKARAEELVRKSEETEVKEAVEKARERWQQMLAQEGRQSVEKALSTARQQWQARSQPSHWTRVLRVT